MYFKGFQVLLYWWYPPWNDCCVCQRCYYPMILEHQFLSFRDNLVPTLHHVGHLSPSNATCAHKPKESRESFFNYYMQPFSPQNWMSPLSQDTELMPETDNTLLHSHASFALTQKHSFLQEKIVKAKWLLVGLWSSSWGMLEHSWILAEVLADVNASF